MVRGGGYRGPPGAGAVLKAYNSLIISLNSHHSPAAAQRHRQPIRHEPSDQRCCNTTVHNCHMGGSLRQQAPGLTETPEADSPDN